MQPINKTRYQYYFVKLIYSGSSADKTARTGNGVEAEQSIWATNLKAILTRDIQHMAEIK